MSHYLSTVSLSDPELRVLMNALEAYKAALHKSAATLRAPGSTTTISAVNDLNTLDHLCVKLGVEV